MNLVELDNLPGGGSDKYESLATRTLVELIVYFYVSSQQIIRCIGVMRSYTR